MTAVNPLRGEATLDSGGKTYTLVFDVNAFCYAEERLGKTTDEILAWVNVEFASWDRTALEKGGNPRVNLILTRTLLWAGLQEKHPGTHIAEAGWISSQAGIAATVGAVLNGFYAAFGVEDEQGPRPPVPAAGETGTG